MTGGGGGIIIIKPLLLPGSPVTDKERKELTEIQSRLCGGIATPKDAKRLGKIAESVAQRA